MTDTSEELPPTPVVVVHHTDPLVRALLLVALGMQAVGLIIIGLLALNTNDTVKDKSFREESGQVIEHRVRNELSHGCIVDYLEGLKDGVNNVIKGKAQIIVVKNTCPAPLTKAEIEHLQTTTTEGATP